MNEAQYNQKLTEDQHDAEARLASLRQQLHKARTEAVEQKDFAENEVRAAESLQHRLRQTTQKLHSMKNRHTTLEDIISSLSPFGNRFTYFVLGLLVLLMQAVMIRKKFRSSQKPAWSLEEPLMQPSDSLLG